MAKKAQNNYPNEDMETHEFESLLNNPESIDTLNLPKPVLEAKDKLSIKDTTAVLVRYASRYCLTKEQTLNSISYFCQEGGYYLRFQISKPESTEN
jgi:hypothetical protein